MELTELIARAASILPGVPSAEHARRFDELQSWCEVNAGPKKTLRVTFDKTDVRRYIDPPSVRWWSARCRLQRPTNRELRCETGTAPPL
jgi:hypothetical protein